MVEIRFKKKNSENNTGEKGFKTKAFRSTNDKYQPVAEWKRGKKWGKIIQT